MNNQETFIKMCKQSKKIQALRGKGKWQAWDYIYATDYHEEPPEPKSVLVVSGYETDSGFYGPMAGSDRYPDDERVPDDAVWLPTQSQLQEMYYTEQVRDRYGTSKPIHLSLVISRFASPPRRYRPLPNEVGTTQGDLLNKAEVEYPEQFTSMEQLWLAFVHEAKYGESWNGQAWERINT